MYSNIFKPVCNALRMSVIAIGLTAAICAAPEWAVAQAAASADPSVRATQQWEELLLVQDFDYLQLTPQQCRDMMALADYARGRLDEVDQQRRRLQASIQAQHDTMLKGALPTSADQQDVLQKQQFVHDRQEAVAGEIVDRVAPKLGAILTRKQTVRAWLLMQNKVPSTEPKRVALLDVASGFVLPHVESRDAIEEIVKTTLRQTYPPDVVDTALTPWEFASLAPLAGTIGQGGPGAGGPAAQGRALQAIQNMDPSMAARMLTLGQRFLKQFSGAADPSAPQPPPVSPEVRAAINRDAAAIRKSIESDPEAYLAKANGNQMLDVLRPLTRRLFVSPRLREALTTRTK